MVKNFLLYFNKLLSKPSHNLFTFSFLDRFEVIKRNVLEILNEVIVENVENWFYHKFHHKLPNLNCLEVKGRYFRTLFEFPSNYIFQSLFKE